MFKTIYPNKVFDYMAAKKPTIISANDVICDMISKSKGSIRWLHELIVTNARMTEMQADS